MVRVGDLKRIQAIGERVMQSLMQLVWIDEAINALGGVFPGDDDFNCLHLRPGDNYFASRWSRIIGLPYICTRAEFEARKAERQNKPGWDKAPVWANWLAQDGYGLWFFSQNKLGNDFIQWTGQGRCFASGCVGEVIGDWRNTLEQRPARIHPTGDIGQSVGTVGANHIGEADEKGCFDFEAFANQFDDADDINAVWALRDKLHHKNKPEPSPELSFHLSNAFNELQASARLLPEDDPRRAQIVALAGGVSAVKEVV